MKYAPFLCITLAGCAAQPPAPQKVYIAVPAPCLEPEQLPAAPVAKTDAELAAMGDFDLVVNLAADRLEYRRYSSEAQAVLKACTK